MTFLRVVAAAALLAPAMLIAQGSRAYAPIVLQLPGGARPLSMGNVGIGSRDDDVIFYNPSQLVNARGFSASAERYSSTAGGGSLSGVTRLNNGGIGIGVRVLDYEAQANGFPATRATSLDAGSGSGTALEASIGVAQVIKGLRVGGAAKYVEDNAQLVRVSRAALDVGVSKDMFRFYTIGLTVQNIGRSMSVPCSNTTKCTSLVQDGPMSATLTRVKLPLRTTLGFVGSHQLGEFDFVGTAAVSVLYKDFVIPAGGMELGYSWLSGYSIALRAGARRPLPGEQAFTAGAGYTMDRLSIDYALETLSGSRMGHRVGLRVR
jgi:hypothetical protein